MRTRQVLAAALTLFGTLGVFVIRARPEQGADGGTRPLDPDVLSVRLLLGVGDERVDRWDGRVSIDRGEVVAVDGYRFRAGDATDGRAAWKAKSHLIRKGGPAKAVRAKIVAKGPSTFGPEVAPNGVVVDLKAAGDATLSVETSQGQFRVPLADLADGGMRRHLDGRVIAQRVPPRAPIAGGPDAEDFPAAAADPKGGAWVAYVVHKPFGPEVLESFTEPPKSFAQFVPTGGGDQIRLVHFIGGRPGEPLDVTRPGLDVWRPAVAVDGQGRVVVAWSQNEAGNWDIYCRTYDPDARSWSSDVTRLTTNPGTDTDVVLASHPKFGVWMAWQAWRDGQADIHLATTEGPADDAAHRVSRTPANEWAPSLAIAADGRAFIAFDTYRAGHYDVVLHEVSLGGGPRDGRDVAIASSPRYEARPTVAVDPRGRAWVAYEERDANWGKDTENLLDGRGATLYRSAAAVDAADASWPRLTRSLRCHRAPAG
jgi:hypothetical protein